MEKQKDRMKIAILLIMSLSLLLTGCKNERLESNSEIMEESSDELGTQQEETGSFGETEVRFETESEVEKEPYTSIAELVPSTVIPEEDLDLSDLSNFFLSSQIIEGDEVYLRINGKSYQPNKDIALSELRYLKVLHYNYDGEIQVGEIIVNARIEKDCLEIFQALFEAEYQICQMVLIDNFWTGDGVETDAVSIKKNNTSSFNYRYVPGSTKRSKHALGLAIDINPYENPYIPTSGGVPDYSALDEQEYYYATNRKETDLHVITHEDLAYKLFKAHGFTWGGDWNSLKDYQHFQKD